uniref:Protein kinase domain-containing protein n=1 Tax=Oryza rufipogon TaxID=4529 RepID=A0A0E0Q8J2_ORYRU
MGCFFYSREKNKNKNKKQSRSSPTLTVDKDDFRDEMSQKANRSCSLVVASSPRSILELYEERAHELRDFRLAELRSATGNFSRELKIGEGGFGSVYKGFLKTSCGHLGLRNDSGNVVVAVKKLNPNGMQGHKQWLAEVQFLAVVDHPNLVQLIGYCGTDNGEQGPQRLLVYEFMPNKTLEYHLFNKAYPTLPWKTRLSIALGVAKGLQYLHEGLEIQVIYRDLKSSNVLLDEEFRPKLSEFGLAREGPVDGQTHVSTAVMGTYGYAAPDYVETGRLTASSDVWSFGVVLLELLTGHRAFDRSRPRPDQKLVDWARRHPAGTRWFSRLPDPRLAGRYSHRAAQDVAALAWRCLADRAGERPSMAEAARALERAARHGELDGPPEPPEEGSPPPPRCHAGSGSSSPEAKKAATAKRRRMAHLAKLAAGASAAPAARRLVHMKMTKAAASSYMQRRHAAC